MASKKLSCSVCMDNVSEAQPLIDERESFLYGDAKPADRGGCADARRLWGRSDVGIVEFAKLG